MCVLQCITVYIYIYIYSIYYYYAWQHIAIKRMYNDYRLQYICNNILLDCSVLLHTHVHAHIIYIYVYIYVYILYIYMFIYMSPPAYMLPRTTILYGCV